MKMFFRGSTILGLLALAAAYTPHATAAVVMDQIGSSPAFFTGANANTSQVFSDYPTYSIAAVDDFSVSASFLTLTNVTAATLGFSGFTSYSNITGYEVNIYSSAAAAAASLNGNISHIVVVPTAATVTTPYSGDSTSALVSLPVNIQLPAAGTYYVSVLADLTFGTGGELGIYGSTGLAGSNPGGVNGFQTNPGGGFGFSGTQADNVDFAYRITAVPEPSTWALLGIGAVGAAFAIARRRAA